jgi:hypothetical protein
MNIRHACWSVLLPSLLVLACGSDSGSQGAAAGGKGGAQAGSAGQSGANAGSAGLPSSAGATSGGAPSTAGVSAGGKAGSAATAGAAGQNQAGAAGTGAVAGAGAPTGGTVTATGGAQSSGGTPVSSTGGATTQGGGTNSTGGAATGGAATGGQPAPTGGTGVGGQPPATGGTVTGGAGGASNCVVGDPCTPPSPSCHTGTIACNSGVASCTETTSAAPNGQPCGTDQVCHNGTCTACAAGTACTSPDPCGQATISCGLGVPICGVSSAKPGSEGTACGVDNPGTCHNGHCQCSGGLTYYAGDCQSCPSFGTSTTVYVDADPSVGEDNTCCGRTQNHGLGGPCRTIGQAITVAQSTWSVNVKGDAAGGNVSPEETYPIHLAKGLTIAANGTVCVPGVSGKNVFAVDVDTATSNLYYFIIGRNCQGSASGALDGVYVGTTPTGQSTTSTIYSVTIEKVVNGIHVDGGTASGYGTISKVSGYGLLCRSDTVTTANSTVSGSLTINQAAKADAFASTNCTTGASGNLTLSLGTTSGVCPSPKLDKIGVYAESNARLSLYGSNIRCMDEDAVTLRAGANLATNAPSVSVDVSNLEHSGCVGAYAEVGTLRMTRTLVAGNHWGVVERSGNSSTVASDAMVNLSGMNNTSDVHNSFKCNGKSERGACCTASSCPNGGDIWNNSGLPLDATYDYWSVAPIPKCLCDSNQQNCTCTGSAQGQTTPPDALGVLRAPLQAGQTAGTVDTANYVLLSDLTCP